MAGRLEDQRHSPDDQRLRGDVTCTNVNRQLVKARRRIRQLEGAAL